MGLKKLYIRITLSVICLIFSSCNDLQELINKPQWPNTFREILNTVWTSDDGELVIHDGTNCSTSYEEYISGQECSIISPWMPNAIFYLHGVRYTGCIRMFGDYLEDPKTYHLCRSECFFNTEHEIYSDEGKIELLSKHTDTDLTVKLTGPLNYGPVRIRIGEANISSVKVSVLNDYKGLHLQGEKVNGVVADGVTRLYLELDVPSAIVRKVVPYIEGEAIDEGNDVYGTFERFDNPSSGMVGFVYTAPSKMPYDNGKDGFISSISFKIDYESSRKGEIQEVPQFKICRPGIVLIPGFLGFGSLFNPMKRYLTDSGFDPSQISIASYPASGVAGFYENSYIKRVVENEVEALYNKMLIEGIASSKFDLIGYSMGGILARLYAQEINPESVNKLITINTPHYGSEIADVGKNVLLPMLMAAEMTSLPAVVTRPLSRNYEKSACENLATSSSAMTLLNGPDALRAKDIAMHACCSKIEWNNIPPETADVKAAMLASFYNPIAGTFELLKLMYNGLPESLCNDLFRDDSDGVVALYSQCGGIADQASTIHSAKAKGVAGISTETHHLNICKQESTHTSVRQLLMAEVDSKCFEKGGFGKSNAINSVAKRVKSLDKDDFLNLSSLSKADGLISVDVQVYTGKIKLDISVSTEVVRYIVMISDGTHDYIFPGDSKMEFNWENSNEFNPNASDFTVCILGRTANNQLIYSLSRQ